MPHTDKGNPTHRSVHALPSRRAEGDARLKLDKSSATKGLLKALMQPSTPQSLRGVYSTS